MNAPFLTILALWRHQAMGGMGAMGGRWASNKWIDQGPVCGAAPTILCLLINTKLILVYFRRSGCTSWNLDADWQVFTREAWTPATKPDRSQRYNKARLQIKISSQRNHLVHLLEPSENKFVVMYDSGWEVGCQRLEFPIGWHLTREDSFMNAATPYSFSFHYL